MDMRPSKVLQKLRGGETVSCFKINLADPRGIAIAALSGFDCLWTDMEHVPNTIETIEKQIFAAKAYGTDLIVRVPRGAYSDYIKPLEADAAGIMVPHLMGLDDAKRVVKNTRFFPVGLRPVDGGNADGAYCMVDCFDYAKQANEQRLVIVQIEDPEPLEHLDEICALEGIDMIFFGPADFSQAVGVPYDFGNPVIEETRRRIAETAVRHGKFAGTVGSLDNLGHLIDLGYRFLSVGADVVGLGNYCRDIVSGFSQIAGGPGTLV